MRIDKDTPIEVIREKLVDGMTVEYTDNGLPEVATVEVTEEGGINATKADGKLSCWWVCDVNDDIPDGNWHIDLSEIETLPLGVSVTITQTPAELLKVEATKLEEAIKCALGEFSDKTGLAVGNISHCVETMRTGIGDLQSLWYHDIEVDIEWKGAI